MSRSARTAEPALRALAIDAALSNFNEAVIDEAAA
jgi:hypothetical protein